MNNSKEIQIVVNQILDNKILTIRERNTLKHRYGLSVDKKPKTLQWIGDKYKTSRERIRQIKEKALQKLKENFKEDLSPTVLPIQNWLKMNGFVVDTETLLDGYSEKNNGFRNALVFLSEFDDNVKYRDRNNKTYFNERWYSSSDEDFVNCLESSINTLYNKIRKDDRVIEESEFLNLFKECMDLKIRSKFSNDNAFRWLKITDKIKKNKFGEWGISSSPYIKFNSTRHRLMYILRESDKSEHFSDLHKKVNKKFNCKIGLSTCHNELIRSDKFILVGRGKYNLSDKKGITSGTVKDRIIKKLKEFGPMEKQEIIDLVGKECEVKDTTIVNALYNKNHFQRGKDNKWKLI